MKGFIVHYDTFWSFIQPSSGRRYMYIKEKYAVEEASTLQST